MPTILSEHEQSLYTPYCFSEARRSCRRHVLTLHFILSYRSDSLIRKEMYLSPLTVSELKRIVDESEIVKSVQHTR